MTVMSFFLYCCLLMNVSQHPKLNTLKIRLSNKGHLTVEVILFKKVDDKNHYAQKLYLFVASNRKLSCFYDNLLVFPQQEPLKKNERNCIMNDFRFLNEISAALSTLRIVIGFLKLSFPAPEQKLMAYVKKDLKLEDRAKSLNLQVQPFFLQCFFSMLETSW